MYHRTEDPTGEVRIHHTSWQLMGWAYAPCLCLRPQQWLVRLQWKPNQRRRKWNGRLCHEQLGNICEPAPWKIMKHHEIIWKIMKEYERSWKLPLFLLLEPQIPWTNMLADSRYFFLLSHFIVISLLFHCHSVIALGNFCLKSTRCSFKLRELHAVPKGCWATWRVRMQPCRRSFGRTETTHDMTPSDSVTHLRGFGSGCCSMLSNTLWSWYLAQCCLDNFWIHPCP